ncbi:VOC family protein [Phaeobacter italicus]|nr:VOC family protein [Phaeobacter italicus]
MGDDMTSVGHFTWTDLSTYDMAAAKTAYSTLFGWRFEQDATYAFATQNGDPAAAVFPMPEFLAKINMPSFWMSYVQVDDLDKAVDIARGHPGTIIEIEPHDFDGATRIALVRDPAGAGFTLVQGSTLMAPASQSSPHQAIPGQVLRRYHHVPDITLIEGFYGALFGWSFHKIAETPWPVYDIRHPDGSLVAQAEEVPETIRGKFRYWMPCFAVPSLDGARSAVQRIGGEITRDLQDGRLMAADSQGAAFMIQAAGDPAGATAAPATDHSPRPWRAALGLLCIWLAVVMELPLFWGVLFLLWSWSALRAGRADFIDPVDRQRNPLLFWGLSATWIGLSLWMIGAALGLF